MGRERASKSVCESEMEFEIGRGMPLFKGFDEVSMELMELQNLKVIL